MRTNAINVLKSKKVPVRSSVKAITHLRENGYFEASRSDFIDMIEELTGVRAKIEDSNELNFTFRYVVERAIKDKSLSDRSLFEAANIRAKEYLNKKEGIYVPPTTSNLPVIEHQIKAEVNGEKKLKKGAKKLMSQIIWKEKIFGKNLTRKEGIAILMEEVGLTAAGASTYYANLKNGSW